MADDDAVEAMYQMPGTEGDSARASYDSMPLASETPADVTSRQYQADTATRAYGRIKAADLNSRGIPSYTDTSGAAKPFVDDTGAPLTNSDPKNDVAYDSGGKAVKYSNRNPTLTPTVTGAYDGAPTQTDKQGNVYVTPKGLPWVWQGVDPDVAAQAQQTQQDQLNQQTSNALAPYEQQAKVAASQAQRAANQSAKATMAIMTQSGASLSDPDGNPVDLKDVDGPTLKGAIQDSFDKEYAAPAANDKPWFGGGQYSSAATAIRADIDNRKQKAMTAADTHIDALTNAQQAGDAYNEIQQQRLQLASAKLDSVNQSRLSQGMEPVSIPGLEMTGPTGNNGPAGGPSGNADANAPVASQGQAPTAIPGLEASRAEPPANPPISQEDHQKIDAALPAPAKQALAPVKTDADGKVQPEGFWATAGRAFGTKIIPSVATAVGGLAAGTLASESGPGAIAADIAGGTAAGYGVAKAQRAIMGDKWANENDAQMAANAKAHPVAAQIGTIVPFLVSILGGGGGGIARAGEEGALKLGTNTVTQAGKQAVEEAIATGTKAALPTAERVIQSAAAGARGGGGAEAQNPDATPGSVADAMAKNALAFGATGLFAPAKTILQTVLNKPVKDAAAMALAGSMYDTAIHGQPFDIKKIAEQTGANIPAFVLQNALLGFLGHGMAAKSGESGGPEAKSGETPPEPQGGPQSPIPGIEPTSGSDPHVPESPKSPSSAPSEDADAIIRAIADQHEKAAQLKADRAAKGPTLTGTQKLNQDPWGGVEKTPVPTVEQQLAKIEENRQRTASGQRGLTGGAQWGSDVPVDSHGIAIKTSPLPESALKLIGQRLEAVEGLPKDVQDGQAAEEKSALQGILADHEAGFRTEAKNRETSVEESPTSEPVSAEAGRQPETQPKGTQVEYAPETKVTEAAKKTSPIDEVPDAKPGESKLAESAAKEAGVEYQGKGMGLHAFKEPETGGNFSIPEGDVTLEKVKAGADAVKKAFAANPILGVGEHTEADIDRAIALAKTPKNEKENTAASKGAPQAGGNEPASAGGAGADEKRGGQAAEISPEHAKSAVTKLRNGKLKPQFDLLQTRLEHLGPSASSTAESGLRAQVNPNTQKLEILHDAAGTADSMKTVQENWMQRGLSAEDGKKQATQWLNSAMNEELIHARQLVFERGGPQFDKTYAKIWREQIPEPIRQLVVALRNRKESDAERGAEYERMVIQQRETGTITEAHVGSPKYEEFYEALKPFLETPQSGPMEDNIARVMTLHAEHEEPEATAEEPKEAEAKPAPKEEGRGPPKRKLQRQLAASKPEFYKEMAQYVAEDDTKQKATEPSEDEIKDIAQAYRDELPKSDFSSLKIADVMERAGYADQTMLQGKQHLAWMWKHGLISSMPTLDWSLVDDRTRAWGVNIHGEGPHGASLAMAMPASIPGLESLAASKPSKEAEPFYSQLTKSIESIPQNVMSVEQARAAVMKGAKKDEIEMSGILSDPLSPLVDQKPGASVTKGQLLGFAIEREAKTQDVTLSQGGSVFKEGFKTREELMDHINGDDALVDESGALKPKLHISHSEEVWNLLDTGKESDQTHFSSYQLPGGDPGSYREQFVTWPQPKIERQTAEQWAAKYNIPLTDPRVAAMREQHIRSSEHDKKDWSDGHAQYDDIANPIVRIRRNIRTDTEGNKTLFLEEMQGPASAEQDKMPPAIRKRIYEIGVKRAIREAAAEGATHLGWTTGTQQAERYSLEKHAKSIVWMEGSDRLKVTGLNGDTVMDKAVSKDELPNVIGKEVAQRLIDQPANNIGVRQLDGEGLKVGGQGLKALYDVTLPRIANEIAKKFGAKTGAARIVGPDEKEKKFASLAAAESWVAENGAGKRLNVEMANGKFVVYDSDAYGHVKESFPVGIHSLPLPEALRDKAVYEGFSLFASKPERQPDTGKVGEAESPVENLTREAEQAGVVLKTDELKGLIRQDPAVMAAVRAKIKIRTGEDALWAAKPLSVKLEELSETTGLTSLIDFIQKGLSPDDRLTQEERLRFAASGDPNSIGDARKTGMILDGVTARAARKYQQRVAALREARELISKLPEAQQLEFMLRVDEGTPIKDGPYSKVLDQFIKMDKQQVDAAKAALDSLGMDHWKNFENYQKYMVPHYFENADEASKLVDQMIQEKKRMLGSTDFLKHRADMTMREVIDWAKAKGIELKPKNLNLVDAYMDRTYQQDRFFGAHEMIQAMERNGTGKWQDTDYVPKRGEKMVNNIIGNRTVEVSPASTEIVDGRVVTTPAKRKKQFFFAAEPSAAIVNNYLSKGLRQDHKFIERYFQAANVLNAAQLSLSAFHGFFVTTEGMVSGFSLGLEKVLHGDIKGFKDMALAPFSTWHDWKLGGDVRKTLLDPTKGNELHQQIINQMVDAGFRGGLDSFYKNNHIDKFWDAIRQHKIWGTALHAPLAAIEYAAKPIMEHFVPRMKAAAVYKMAAMMLARRPNIGPEEFQRDMQEAVRSGNNRFGEMTYDNLHLNKVVKDLLMAVQRSVGWNWGDFSELGGGLADWAKFAKNSILYGARKIGGGGKNPPDDPANKDFLPGGKKFPRVTHRMAYVLALPLIIGFFGALLSAMFGQSVERLKDLYFVKTGEVDDHGHPVRVVIPSYMKDFWAWTKHPVESMVNKLHPILSTLGAMLLNRDYYSVEIRHDGDPILKQILSEAKYAGKQFLPFSFTNSSKLKGSEVSTPLKIATGTGALLVAPSYAGKSDAQNLADDIVRESMPTKSRTQEAADHSALRSQLVGLARIGKGQDEMAQAVASGKLDSKDVAYIHRQAQLTPLQASVSHLGLPDALKVEAIATPKEQQELRPMIAAKAQRSGKPMYRMSGY